jgi:3-oxoacyl-[acyl-carrier-protein] synthase-3
MNVPETPSLLTAAVYGTGSYAPSKVMTNLDFCKTLETSDEWITSRTGIKERRIADPSETTSDLCLKAAQAALENAKVDASEIDLILVGTVTPDYHMPSTACIVQEKLGIATKCIPAFDLSAACSGFVYGMSTAQAYIRSGMAKRVLIIGAEIISRILDYKDRTSCILFGDGAGAVVMGPERTDGPSHTVLSTRLRADGRGAPLLYIPAGGAQHPATAATVAENQHFVRLDGKEIFRFGITIGVELIKEAMEVHQLKVEDLGAIIPHQANIRIIESVAERLNIPLSLFVTNLDRYGNTSAASVPIALDEANRTGRMPKGKPVIMLAFGAGLTWSSAVLRW